MEKNILNLAGIDYIVECNFRKQHDLTKFRNKLSYGIDFSDAEKSVIEEILQYRQDLSNGKELKVSDLSDAALSYLAKTANKADVFSSDELIEIGMLLINNKSSKEVEAIFDEEVRMTSYDDLVNKLIHAMTTVFTNAKSGLNEE